MGGRWVHVGRVSEMRCDACPLSGWTGARGCGDSSRLMCRRTPVDSPGRAQQPRRAMRAGAGALHGLRVACGRPNWTPRARRRRCVAHLVLERHVLARRARAQVQVVRLAQRILLLDPLAQLEVGRPLPAVRSGRRAGGVMGRRRVSARSVETGDPHAPPARRHARAAGDVVPRATRLAVAPRASRAHPAVARPANARPPELTRASPSCGGSGCRPP